MSRQPSRPVTRVRCAACGERFTPSRADARYCKAACRQRAHRARAQLDDLDRRIEEARMHYWKLVREKTRALGAGGTSRVVTAEAPFVDERGDVYMHGRCVGHIAPDRDGWATWGLEAAGPPFSPPPEVRR